MTRTNNKRPQAAAVLEKEPIEIKINLDGLTWRDVKQILAFNGAFTPEIIDLIDRVVVGGLLDLPFFETAEVIMSKLVEEIEARKNPVDGAGKN